MRRILFVISAAAACGFGACERKPAADTGEDRKRQEQRDADERRIAELRELEQRAADREADAAAAEIERQHQELAEERAKLERERADLNEEQRRATDARLARIQDEERENERREELRRAEQRKRDQRLAEERLTSERAEQTLDFFYDALEPEGDWIEVERFGYCWQPRLAQRADWRPYVDGHWAYTEYGWTWVSREPFGWATYHYGRWTRVRGLGWVWVPGSEWAPAWVSWRRSDRHIGWAPLPPEAHSRSGFTAAVDIRYDIGPGLYNFVAIENLGAPTYVKEVLQPEQNITIVQQTVNVTNITYVNVDNRVTVRNEGPQFAEVNQRAKVRRMNVERVTKGSAPTEERGDTLRLLAPVVAPAAREARPPKRVRENIKAPEMERGWAGASPAVRTAVRDQQKKEARNAEQLRPGTRPASIAPAAPATPTAPAKVEKPRTEPPTPTAPAPAVPSTAAPKPSSRPTTPPITPKEERIPRPAPPAEPVVKPEVPRADKPSGVSEKSPDSAPAKPASPQEPVSPKPTPPQPPAPMPDAPKRDLPSEKIDPKTPEPGRKPLPGRPDREKPKPATENTAHEEPGVKPSAEKPTTGADAKMPVTDRPSKPAEPLATPPPIKRPGVPPEKPANEKADRKLPAATPPNTPPTDTRPNSAEQPQPGQPDAASPARLKPFRDEKPAPETKPAPPVPASDPQNANAPVNGTKPTPRTGLRPPAVPPGAPSKVDDTQTPGEERQKKKKKAPGES